MPRVFAALIAIGTLAGSAVAYARDLPVVTVAAAPSASQQDRFDSLRGTWEGEYVCAQGVTGLILTVEGKTPDQVSARFRFFPLPENPQVPRGEFELSGSFDEATGRFELSPTRWIDQPDGYGMVPLIGQLDAAARQLRGRIPFASCVQFTLSRSPD